MNRDKLDRAQALFDAALELDAADRDAMLATMCGDDEEVLTLVRRLLAAHGDAQTRASCPAPYRRPRRTGARVRVAAAGCWDPTVS